MLEAVRALGHQPLVAAVPTEDIGRVVVGAGVQGFVLVRETDVVSLWASAVAVLRLRVCARGSRDF